MSETNGIDYKAKCQEYERRMGIGSSDPARDGYLVLIKILNQQNKYLEKFEIKDLISTEDKAKATEYKNAKDLWENLPSMISKVNTLKAELKIEGEEKKETLVPISPKAIADGLV